jgi:hypothetical protein
MDEQKELRDAFRQQQERFVYYVIALSVTAIGFSIYKTTGQSLKWSQIPLGLSVLTWGLSIYYGLSFLKYSISTLFSNNTYLNIQKGQEPWVGTDQEKIKMALKELKAVMNDNIKTAEKFSARQQRLFYFGVASFIIWHVIEMYFTTKS